MPLTDDDFLKDSKLELYNEVIESLQEQEEKVEEIGLSVRFIRR